jgi:hypothetical protein
MALGPSQLSTYKVAFTHWVKWQLCQTEDLLPSAAEIMNDRICTSSSLVRLRAVNIQTLCFQPTMHLYFFSWISERTAIISLYNVNLSVFITEAECLLRGTNWVFKRYGYSFVLKGLTFVYQNIRYRRSVNVTDV